MWASFGRHRAILPSPRSPACPAGGAARVQLGIWRWSADAPVPASGLQTPAKCTGAELLDHALACLSACPDSVSPSGEAEAAFRKPGAAEGAVSCPVCVHQASLRGRQNVRPHVQVALHLLSLIIALWQQACLVCMPELCVSRKIGKSVLCAVWSFSYKFA